MEKILKKIKKKIFNLKKKNQLHLLAATSQTQQTSQQNLSLQQTNKTHISPQTKSLSNTNANKQILNDQTNLSINVNSNSNVYSSEEFNHNLLPKSSSPNNLSIKTKTNKQSSPLAASQYENSSNLIDLLSKLLTNNVNFSNTNNNLLNLKSLYSNRECQWPECPTGDKHANKFDTFDAYLKFHLSREHTLDEKSHEQLVKQMHLVDTLDIELKKQRQILNDMLLHLNGQLNIHRQQQQQEQIQRQQQQQQPYFIAAIAAAAAHQRAFNTSQQQQQQHSNLNFTHLNENEFGVKSKLNEFVSVVKNLDENADGYDVEDGDENDPDDYNENDTSIGSQTGEKMRQNQKTGSYNHNNSNNQNLKRSMEKNSAALGAGIK